MSKLKPDVVKALEGSFKSYERVGGGRIAFYTGDADAATIYYRPVYMGFLLGFERLHEFSTMIEYVDNVKYRASRTYCKISLSPGVKRRFEIECEDEDLKNFISSSLSKQLQEAKPEILLVDPSPGLTENRIVVLARKYTGMGLKFSRDIYAVYKLVIDATKTIRRWIEI
ncbi:MAG: hypothetical protein QXQ29_05135 [Candidatus Bathyarchaeia archaeon]